MSSAFSEHGSADEAVPLEVRIINLDSELAQEGRDVLVNLGVFPHLLKIIGCDHQLLDYESCTLLNVLTLALGINEN